MSSLPKKKFLFIAIAFFFLFFKKNQAQNLESKNHPSRIISLNSSISEIISALGAQNEIVGRDVTSLYPSSLLETSQNLGHISQISTEGVLLLNPTYLIAAENELKPLLKNQLKKSGIKIFSLPIEHSIKGAKTLIHDIAQILGGEAKKKVPSLILQIDKPLKKLKKISKKPKILFLYTRNPNNLLAAGKNTPIEKIIELAGGENAIKNFENYKPLNTEALLEINPDAILIFDNFLEAIGGKEGLLKIPSMRYTKAGKSRSILTIKATLISNSGPRIGEGIQFLNESFSKLKL